MIKKLFIISFLIALTGGGALSWLTYEEASQYQLQSMYEQEHPRSIDDYLVDYSAWIQLPEAERGLLPWEADYLGNRKRQQQLDEEKVERFIAHADKLSRVKPEMYSLAELLYGSDWQDRLDLYIEQQKSQKKMFVAAATTFSIGVVLVIASFVLRIANMIYEKKRIRSACRGFISSEDDFPERKKVSINTILKTDSVRNQWPVPDEADNETTNKAQKLHKKKLYTDFDSIKIESARKGTDINLCEKLKTESNPNPITKDEQEYRESFFSSYQNIKDKTNNVARKIADAGKESRQDSEILDNTLSKLTSEVAAIRQYASQQQDRVKKLAEGYDWKVIRNFGLRVIRCVDNLERRIQLESENSDVTEHLEEVRDELLFALESSGLERYEPKTNSDYRGQEKTAEAIKDRQPGNSADMKGKVADVIRCGYKYVLDDESFKVVRTAQVKLFD